MKLGESLSETIYNVIAFTTFSLFISLSSCVSCSKFSNIALGLPYGILFGTFFSIVFGVDLSIAKNLLGSFRHTYCDGIRLLGLGSFAGGTVVGLSTALVVGQKFKVVKSFIIPSVVGIMSLFLTRPFLPLAVSLMFGGSVVFFATLGLLITLWRPILTYPLFVIWNSALYFLDQYFCKDHNISLLRYHSAFWDEYQKLPWIGLDKHLIYVLKTMPTEGRSAFIFLMKTNQKWATEVAQEEIEINWF